MTRHAQERLAQRYFLTLHTQEILLAIENGRATRVIDKTPRENDHGKWYIVSVSGDPIMVLTINKALITVLPHTVGRRVLNGKDRRFYIKKEREK